MTSPSDPKQEDTEPKPWRVLVRCATTVAPVEIAMRLASRAAGYEASVSIASETDEDTSARIAEATGGRDVTVFPADGPDDALVELSRLIGPVGFAIVEVVPPGEFSRAELTAQRDRLQRACDEGLPREVILCPRCHREHVDGDNGIEFKTRPHHTHRCQFCQLDFPTNRWSFGVASSPSAPTGAADAPAPVGAEAGRSAVIESMRAEARELVALLRSFPRTRLADAEGVTALKHWIVQGVQLHPTASRSRSLSYADLMGDPKYRAVLSARPKEKSRVRIGLEITTKARRFVRMLRASMLASGFSAADIDGRLASTVVEALL